MFPICMCWIFWAILAMIEVRRSFPAPFFLCFLFLKRIRLCTSCGFCMYVCLFVCLDSFGCKVIMKRLVKL